MNLEPLPGIYSAESLREWLSKFAPTQEVGIKCNSHFCPAAEWLRAETEKSIYAGEWEIRVQRFQDEAADEFFETPKWLQDFQHWIDRLKVKGPRGSITAAQALAALDAAVESEAA